MAKKTKQKTKKKPGGREPSDPALKRVGQAECQECADEDLYELSSQLVHSVAFSLLAPLTQRKPRSRKPPEELVVQG